MFRELIPNIEEDCKNGVYSRILQDERHFNYYFWKHSNDSDINIRILSPSYLYPHHPIGFTDWVIKENRPIVVHGIAHHFSFHKEFLINADTLHALPLFVMYLSISVSRHQLIKVRIKLLSHLISSSHAPLPNTHTTTIHTYTYIIMVCLYCLFRTNTYGVFDYYAKAERHVVD